MQNDKIKTLDNSGRIVLPKYQRELLGRHANDSIQVTADEQSGQMVLRKAYAGCIRCGGQDDLKQITAYQHLCKACLTALLQE